MMSPFFVLLAVSLAANVAFAASWATNTVLIHLARRRLRKIASPQPLRLEGLLSRRLPAPAPIAITPSTDDQE